MKHSFLILTLAFCTVSPIIAQATFTGTWKADDVGFPPWTFVLKSDGGKVTGWVSQGASDTETGMSTTAVQATEITDGTVAGNRVSFKIPGIGANIITFNGILNGSEIGFTREVVGTAGYTGIYGATGASHFTAKLSSASTEIPGPPAASAGAGAVRGAANTGARLVFIGTGTPWSIPTVPAPRSP